MELQPSVVIFAIINFLILVAILYKFLYGPLTKAMDSRKQGIKEALDAADLAQKEAETTRMGLKEEIQNARLEADKILAAAKKSGDLLRSDMQKKAEEEAKGIIDKARAEITYEKEAALNEIKKEVAGLAVDIATKILQEEMDADLQKKISDKYIKEVGQIQ